MRVAKFGGGCLRTAEDFINVVHLLKEDQSEPIVIVVSAINGVTDILHNSSKFALKSERNIPRLIANLKTKHLEIVEQAINNPALRDKIGKSIEENSRNLNGCSME